MSSLSAYLFLPFNSSDQPCSQAFCCSDVFFVFFVLLLFNDCRLQKYNNNNYNNSISSSYFDFPRLFFVRSFVGWSLPIILVVAVVVVFNRYFVCPVSFADAALELRTCLLTYPPIYCNKYRMRLFFKLCDIGIASHLVRWCVSASLTNKIVRCVQNCAKLSNSTTLACNRVHNSYARRMKAVCHPVGMCEGGHRSIFYSITNKQDNKFSGVELFIPRKILIYGQIVYILATLY